MNKDKLRAFFKSYRQQIAELKEEINSQYYYQDEQSAAISKATERANACRRECEEARRQEESDRWYREDELRRATKDLERARGYGDEWGEARALEKLKKIY